MLGRIAELWLLLLYRSRWRAIAIAATFTLAAVVVRALLIPVWDNEHAYTPFYPAVLLAAYVGGRRAAFAATGLSALIGYWIYVPPSFALKQELGELAYVLFFIATSLVASLVISRLAETLQAIAEEHERSRTLAETHADLFREINERVSQHLNLVGALLALQGRQEEPKISEAMARAAEVSLTLAKLHGDWSRGGDEPVDFMAFAASLLNAKLATDGRPPDSVILSGAPLPVSTAQAAPLGIALLECLSSLAIEEPPRAITIRFEGDARAFTIAMRAAETRTGGLEHVAEAQLLRAVTHQAGGQVSAEASGGESRLRFRFGEARRGGAPEAASLH